MAVHMAIPVLVMLLVHQSNHWQCINRLRGMGVTQLSCTCTAVEVVEVVGEAEGPYGDGSNGASFYITPDRTPFDLHGILNATLPCYQ